MRLSTIHATGHGRAWRPSIKKHVFPADSIRSADHLPTPGNLTFKGVLWLGFLASSEKYGLPVLRQWHLDRTFLSTICLQRILFRPLTGFPFKQIA